MPLHSWKRKKNRVKGVQESRWESHHWSAESDGGKHNRLSRKVAGEGGWCRGDTAPRHNYLITINLHLNWHSDRIKVAIYNTRLRRVLSERRRRWISFAGCVASIQPNLYLAQTDVAHAPCEHFLFSVFHLYISCICFLCLSDADGWILVICLKKNQSEGLVRCAGFSVSV